MAHVIIKNTEARLHILPLADGKLLKLLPGNNPVSPEDWNLARKLVADKLEDGRFVEVVAEEVKGKTDKDPVTVKGVKLKDMDLKKASAIIKGTFDLTALEAWKHSMDLSESQRVEVLQQIEVVNAAAKPKE